jgi:hypothetical protein
MLAVYGSTLGFDTKQRNNFLIKFGVFFKIKARLLNLVKDEKITLFDEFLVMLGPIFSRFFACSNEEKNRKKQRVLALVLSLCMYHIKMRCYI